jgi:hypothetical protein
VVSRLTKCCIDRAANGVANGGCRDRNEAPSLGLFYAPNTAAAGAIRDYGPNLRCVRAIESMVAGLYCVPIAAAFGVAAAAVS